MGDPWHSPPAPLLPNSTPRSSSICRLYPAICRYRVVPAALLLAGRAHRLVLCGSLLLSRVAVVGAAQRALMPVYRPQFPARAYISRRAARASPLAAPLFTPLPVLRRGGIDIPADSSSRWRRSKRTAVARCRCRARRAAHTRTHTTHHTTTYTTLHHTPTYHHRTTHLPPPHSTAPANLLPSTCLTSPAPPFLSTPLLSPLFCHLLTIAPHSHCPAWALGMDSAHTLSPPPHALCQTFYLTTCDTFYHGVAGSAIAPTCPTYTAVDHGLWTSLMVVLLHTCLPRTHALHHYTTHHHHHACHACSRAFTYHLPLHTTTTTQENGGKRVT